MIDVSPADRRTLLSFLWPKAGVCLSVSRSIDKSWSGGGATVPATSLKTTIGRAWHKEREERTNPIDNVSKRSRDHITGSSTEPAQSKLSGVDVGSRKFAACRVGRSAGNDRRLSRTRGPFGACPKEG